MDFSQSQLNAMKAYKKRYMELHPEFSEDIADFVIGMLSSVDNAQSLYSPAPITGAVFDNTGVCSKC